MLFFSRLLHSWPRALHLQSWSRWFAAQTSSSNASRIPFYRRLFSSSLRLRIALVFAVVLTLSACDGEVVVNIDDSHDHGHVHVSVSPFAKLSGVWDSSIVYANNVVNEYYEVIYEDGTYIAYDYLGDSYDRSLNCYLRSTGQLYDLGDNLYELVMDNGDVAVFEGYVYGDTLEMHVVDERGHEHVYISYAQPLSEYDFYPLCHG